MDTASQVPSAWPTTTLGDIAWCRPQRRHVFGLWPSATWLPGVDVDRAVAVYGVLVSLESFAIATHDYGWTPDQVEVWWHETLAGQLLRASP